MWVLSWKKYALSKLATFVSVIGALVRYAGVLCLISSIIPAALICIAIGIGLHFCAESIAKSKANKRVSAAKASAASTAQEPVQVKTTTSAATQSTGNSNGKVKCVHCGALISANNKFCTECGKSLIAESPKQKKCLRCGATAESTSKFCPECGYELK